MWKEMRYVKYNIKKATGSHYIPEFEDFQCVARHDV
jgi:hypothetical protein